MLGRYPNPSNLQFTAKIAESCHTMRHSPGRYIVQSVFSAAAAATIDRLRADFLIRAGGLKTCWTKPPGTAVPQLWALQPGEELRRPEKAAANKERREI